ncbi:MAG TPA: hypothetical protein VD973_23595 [Symbiobacteriaceae bacterium]|nr:hypothetical protein [Symbiobacteriaceae bacterium]
MSVSRRVISVLLRILLRSYWVAMLLCIVLTVVAIVKSVNVGWQPAALWGTAAAVLLLGARVADGNGFMLFAEDEGIGLVHPFRPGVYRALASGRFLQRHWSGLLVHAMVSGGLVQVRWMAGGKPPCIAVLQPHELPEKTYSPLEEAERYVLWHPGSDVRLGWVAVGWSVLPGVELRFIGRRLVLAFDEEEQARAVAEALRSAA